MLCQKSGGAIHVLVSQKVNLIDIKNIRFKKNFIFIRYKNFFKTLILLSRGVEKQVSFEPFSHVFQWEHYLVVCALRRHCMRCA